MRGPEDCSTVTKPNDKGSCVIVWDRTNYILGAENMFIQMPIRRLDLVTMNL